MAKRRRKTQDESEEEVREEPVAEQAESESSRSEHDGKLSDASAQDTDQQDVPDDDEPDAELPDEEASGEDEQVEEEVEEPVVLDPDDEFSVQQLKRAGCRLDVDDSGHVWRVFLYDKHTNAVLNHTLGLPGLRELWVIGSKVTKTAVQELQRELPKTRIHS